MNKKTFLPYMAAFLSIVIPTPARFAYGILMLVTLNIVMLFGTTAKFLIRKLDFEEIEPVCLLVFLFGVTVFCKQLMIFYSPVAALTLSFAIYLIPVSSFVLGYVITDKEMNPKVLYVKNMSASGLFTANALVFYLIRELLSFGSVSFPVRKGIHVVKLISGMLPERMFFFATIPGSFVILAIFTAAFYFIERHIEISRRRS